MKTRSYKQEVLHYYEITTPVVEKSYSLVLNMRDQRLTQSPSNPPNIPWIGHIFVRLAQNITKGNKNVTDDYYIIITTMITTITLFSPCISLIIYCILHKYKHFYIHIFCHD